MSVDAYKCISCGAPISFNAEEGKFVCEYCMSKFTEKELTDYLESKKRAEAIKEIPVDIDENKLKEYHCNNCGAEVVTDDTTSSTFCYYCHSPIILSDKLQGKFLPDKIIPFKISREKATETFKEWASKRKYIPSDFVSNTQLEKITGMYLPFWLGDFEADVDLKAVGINISTWTSGDYEYTKTDKYDFTRNGKIDIDNLGELAFDKIDNNLVNGISPFNEELAIPFSMGYLSGFFAERYNVEKEKLEPIITQNLKTYTSGLIENSGNYDQIDIIADNTKYTTKKWNYVFMPAWVMTYKYLGKIYVIAVNGQTGNIFGELPIYKKKLDINTLICFAATIALLLAGGRFIW